jgi:hypothetical protein
MVILAITFLILTELRNFQIYQINGIFGGKKAWGIGVKFNGTPAEGSNGIFLGRKAIVDVRMFGWRLLVAFGHPDNKLSGLPKIYLMRSFRRSTQRLE